MAPKRMSKNASGNRPTYTPEYRAEVVKLCLVDGRPAAAVARDHGLSVSSVCSWVKQAKIDQAGGTAQELSSEERAELVALRREVRALRRDCEVYKAATALFAKGAMS